jgi:hypothetical protein
MCPRLFWWGLHSLWKIVVFFFLFFFFSNSLRAFVFESRVLRRRHFWDAPLWGMGVLCLFGVVLPWALDLGLEV